jgi:gentisate 1,2-dioxygenase
MKLIQITPAQQYAQHLDAIQSIIIKQIEESLTESYKLFNTEGEEQAILDVLGTNAVKGMEIYVTLYTALAALKPDHVAPAPQLNKFVANEDGTITFVDQ